MKRALLALSAVVAAVLLTTPQASALGKIRCDMSGQPAVSIGRYDPIVNHNGVGSMHEHQFFGNIAWHSLANPNTANYENLVGKANNCRKVLGLSSSADSAGYWVPTLRYTSGPKVGQLIPSQQFTAYYRPYLNRGDFGEGRAFPADTRLIGTDYNWTCGEKSGRRSVPVPTIPDCSGLSGKPGLTLTAHITFPSCWNGVMPKHSRYDVGDTRDNRNYAYPVKKSCPAAFPIEMVALKETIQFAYVGKGNDVGLSSDKMAGVNDGRSLHADFWQTWVQPDFERFVKTCVASTRSGYASSKCDP